MSQVKFSGIGSGIDSSRLADALYQQLTNPNKLRESQILYKEKENTSLEKLRSDLLSLRDSIDSLRSVNGGSGKKVAISSDSASFSAVADSSAERGSFQIEVLSLAKRASGSFSRAFSSQEDRILADGADQGSVAFTVGSGQDANTFEIEIDQATTVADFVAAFNAEAGTKASATLVNVGTESSPSYRVAFSSSQAGVDEGSISISTSSPSLLDPAALGGIELDQATNAKLKISGISGEITRDSNQINDILPGVSLNLKKLGQGTITVATNNDGVKAQVEDFVGRFNALSSFISREDRVQVTEKNGERVNVYNSLARTSADEKILTDIRGIIADTRTSDNLNSLSSFGISTERNGTLAIDEKKLESVINSNPQAVNEVMTKIADKLSGPAGVLHQHLGYQMSLDQAQQANNTAIANLNETMDDLSLRAQTQQDSMLAQFSRFEGYMARLNSDAQFITQLLQFR